MIGSFDAGGELELGAEFGEPDIVIGFAAGFDVGLCGGVAAGGGGHVIGEATCDAGARRPGTVDPLRPEPRGAGLGSPRRSHERSRFGPEQACARRQHGWGLAVTCGDRQGWLTPCDLRHGGGTVGQWMAPAGTPRHQ